MNEGLPLRIKSSMRVSRAVSDKADSGIFDELHDRVQEGPLQQVQREIQDPLELDTGLDAEWYTGFNRATRDVSHYDRP